LVLWYFIRIILIRFTKKIYTYIQTTKLKTKIDYGKN